MPPQQQKKERCWGHIQFAWWKNEPSSFPSFH